MRTLLLPWTALIVLGCSTSQPSAPREDAVSDPNASVGNSEAALRQLGQRDAVDVDKCRAIAASCSADADGGANARCDRIEQHCDELAEQLEQDRADLERCLEAAAACEQSAVDAAECADERAACEPADRELAARRGQTMQCANRAEQCLDRGRGAGGFFNRRGAGADEGDAGAAVCEDDATDFIGCCRGKHGRRDGDAGPDDAFGDRGGFGGGFRDRQDDAREDDARQDGAGPGRGRDDGDDDDQDDDEPGDAGARRRRF